MNLSCALPLMLLVGCGAAAVEGNMPTSQGPCSPHRVPWLKQGSWRFEVTTVDGAQHKSGTFSVAIGPPKKTGDYTLYSLTSAIDSETWAYIGSNTCGDIVVSDGATIYTVFTEATQAWSGVGFFTNYDTSANVYGDANLIPSLVSTMSAYGTNPLTAIGNVDGAADDCIFYEYYGTSCGTGAWTDVTMDLEYWDPKTGPVAWHTASPGHEYRIERTDVLVFQREPDSYDAPSVWPWDQELTGELGPLDKAQAPTKTSAPATASLPQDWVAVTLDAQRTILLDWSGDADLDLMVFAEGTLANIKNVEGKDHAARVTLDRGSYRIAIHRKDTRRTAAVYTLNVITDMQRD